MSIVTQYYVILTKISSRDRKMKTTSHKVTISQVPRLRSFGTTFNEVLRITVWHFVCENSRFVWALVVIPVSNVGFHPPAVNTKSSEVRSQYPLGKYLCASNKSNVLTLTAKLTKQLIRSILLISFVYLLYVTRSYSERSAESLSHLDELLKPSCFYCQLVLKHRL